MRAIRASVVYVPTCQCAKSLPTSHFYVPINVPCVSRWQRRANFSTCRANVPRRASILTWGANVPKGVPFFNFTCQTVCQFFNYFSKELCFFLCLINLCLIYFIYFAYFKYIPNIYFYMNIFF